MRYATAIVLIGVLALAGCGKASEETKTADEVVAEANQLERPRPGQYETTVELIKFEVPGLPPQQAEAMKATMGNVSGQSSASCLTQAEADKGFEESVRKMTENNGAMRCEFGRFDVDGGKIDASMTCKGPQGLTSDITLAGTGSAEATAMHMKMVQKAAMIPGGEMRMEMKMNARRVGDCPR